MSARASELAALESELQQAATGAVKNQAHGALNPKAQYGGRLTVEDVLASREVADPLTVLMCSPIGDGAATLVLCSPEVAARSGAEVKVPPLCW